MLYSEVKTALPSLVLVEDFLVKKISAVVPSPAEILPGVEIYATVSSRNGGKAVERAAENLWIVFARAVERYKGASRPT